MAENFDPLKYLSFQQEQQHRMAMGIRWKEISNQLSTMADSAQKQADAARDRADAALNEVELVRQISESSKIQALLAEKKAKKADTKGIIAIIISLIALLIEAIVNRHEIVAFLQELF